MYQVCMHGYCCTRVYGYMAFVAIAYDMHIVAFLPDLTRAQDVQSSKGVYDHERENSMDDHVGIMWICVEPVCSSQQGLIRVPQ